MTIWIHNEIKKEVEDIVKENHFFRQIIQDHYPPVDMIWPRGPYNDFRNEPTFIDLRTQITENQKKLGQYAEQGLIAFL